MQIDTEKNIIPNWYNKEQLEIIFKNKLSQIEFDNFKLFIEKSSLSEEINELIIDSFNFFKRSNKCK